MSNSNEKTTPIQFGATDELLDIRYDNIFKAVFTKDTPVSKGALSGLVSALIRRKVNVQTITANEPPANNVFDRQIRFDIACKTVTGELVNIEMSFNPKFDEMVRLEYYASRQYSGQDIQGVEKNFADLAETFQIAIIGKEKIIRDKVLVHTFGYYDAEHNIPFGGKSKIITVELEKAEQVIDKPTGEMDSSEKWSTFFQYLTNKDKRGKINEILEREAEIAMAGETLVHISRDEIERARLTTELKNILDYQSGMVTAKRQGRAEGLKKGLAKGQIKGHTEEKHEIARKMKEIDEPLEKIQLITGLDMETIQGLNK